VSIIVHQYREELFPLINKNIFQEAIDKFAFTSECLASSMRLVVAKMNVHNSH
jgi:hypothetical protein